MNLQDIRLLTGLVVAVAILIVLITRWKFNPFVSLLIASITLAIITGLALPTAMQAFAGGVGALLSSTALVIAFGAMMGSILAASGGAELIARSLANALGTRHLGWTMFLVGTIVGIGVWFTVGLVLLVPITITLARITKTHLLVPACAMLAGLSAMHGLAPPHPGPLAAIALLDANIGWTIIWGIFIGVLAGAVAGPMYWSLLPKRFRQITFDVGVTDEPTKQDELTSSSSKAVRPGPSLAAAYTVVLLPVVLMVIASVVSTWMEPTMQANAEANPDRSLPLRIGFSVANGVIFLGNPTIAMLVGLLVSQRLLATPSGITRASLAEITEKSLMPVANVLLIVGAGAGFSRVLIASGVGNTIAELAQQVSLPPLVLGWLIAAAVRVATGSATTGITTAAGLVAVMVQEDPSIPREFMVLAMGAGSLTLSHVNDGGFWFVKEYFGLSVEDTLRTWTVLETILSVVALLIILLIHSVIR